MNLILGAGAFVVLGVHMVSTLVWNEGCMKDMNCRFEDWDCPENCPLYTDHMIDDGELYLPINPGHKVLDEMWKESWYNCHRNNWKVCEQQIK